MQKSLGIEKQALEQITRLEEVVFAANRAELSGELVVLLNILETITLTEDDIQMSVVLQELLQAYQQQDYLLFVDLLTYRLRPLLQLENSGNRRQ